MDLFTKKTELQSMIYKFMEVHNNPHDTSNHNSTATQLNQLDSTLKPITPTHPLYDNIQASVGKNGANNYDDVVIVQKLLGIKADGDSGIKTNLAIRKFQRSLGFRKTDGLVEPNGITWKNLIKNTIPDNSTDDEPMLSSSKTIQASVGRKGVNNIDDVVLVQSLLGLTTDGKCGMKTVKAIRTFQQGIGMSKPDGLSSQTKIIKLFFILVRCKEKNDI